MSLTTVQLITVFLEDYECGVGKRKCKRGGQCLDDNLWCDHYIDCPDKSDEQYCGKYLSYRTIKQSPEVNLMSHQRRLYKFTRSLKMKVHEGSLGQKVHVRSEHYYEKVNGYLLLLDTLSSVQKLSRSRVHFRITMRSFLITHNLSKILTNHLI